MCRILLKSRRRTWQLTKAKKKIEAGDKKRPQGIQHQAKTQVGAKILRML